MSGEEPQGLQLLHALAGLTQVHCPPPQERGPLVGTAPFMLFFQLSNGYLARLVGDAPEGGWKVEVCCGDAGEFDAIERADRPITAFFTAMSFEDSMPFGALFGVSKCGTRERPRPAHLTQEFLEFEARVLGKVAAAARAWDSNHP
jgi:hypothetical protein